MQKNIIKRHAGSAYTRDMMTYDMTPSFDSRTGRQTGYSLGGSYRTHDGRTVDSTGAFLVGELERLDQTLNEPLVDYKWGRDIDLREDVSLADEVSSFTQSSFGAQGGLGTGNGIGNGKAWIGKASTQITGISVDIGKVVHPLRPWATELIYTLLDLASAAKAGRPVDEQLFAGLKMKHQMDIDEMVYFGDSANGATGLVNNTLVTEVANLPGTGSGSSPLWSAKTPAEILADFNFALTTVWTNSAWAVTPNKVLIAPVQFGQIATQTVSTAGNISILKYVLENNIVTTNGAGPLTIVASKWCVGTGAGGTVSVDGAGHNRMVVYNQDKRFVRYPMTMLQNTPVQYEGIYHKTTYYCRLGEVEVVYPETIGYFDGNG